ncbi:conserved hypothetical protein [Talaromyces stipitatus ATCC 10500]|uniref:DOMON domain-containing protein n=1 Tax=Talaromyces stipitatus (strain ATCC 10500 / CBS 375.48 / QM 6759 / NRRL 1006) TaxID=441959 RepID=B8MCC1_TALSN|nr:uncharacterized protein TSTA_122960 [Talaromyces stipitatus ATCC 10500]EED18567.1 conserved hypothetical protein [Talaromyces stipitatus ATCC 10500]
MFVNLLWILCLALSRFVLGQTDNGIQNDPISVFVTSPGSGSGNYVFALNVPSNSGDIYFHLSGPAAYSWVAVGTGSKMKDSLMFIAYLNSTGNGVTLSPRISTDETEPSYSSSINVETLSGTGVFNGTISVNARCTNCTKWNKGSLNLKSTSQSFIYGLGPSSGSLKKLQSDSLSAGIERHSVYGNFVMNMTKATGGTDGTTLLSTTFSSVTTSSGASADGDQTHDSNWPVIIHAVALSVAFIILMPGGAILLRIIPASVRWHWVNQSVATILAGIGGVIGLWLSTMYNRSSSYNSAHQVLGIICVVAVLVQWFLGFWHHWQYKKHQTPTKYGAVHLHMGRIILVLAIVVGAIGLSWSSVKTGVIIAYVVIAGVIVVVVLALSMWKRHFSESLSFLPAFGPSKRSVNSEGSYENLADPFSNRYEYRSYESNTPLASYPNANNSR